MNSSPNCLNPENYSCDYLVHFVAGDRLQRAVD